MKSTSLRLALALVGLAASLALGGCATHCPADGCPADKKLTAQVEAAFQQYTELMPPNSLVVQTLGGVVYLNGQVATDLQRQKAVSVAKSVPGVTKVVDNISLPYQGR